MDVPEELLDKAADVHRSLKSSRDADHLTEIIAQALLSERLAQKERDAKIAYEAALYSGCPADFIAEEIAEAVRNQAPGGIAYRTKEKMHERDR
jgi:hypothetical protein